LNIDYISSIYTNYAAFKDSIKVTRRSILKEMSWLHHRTIFEDLQLSEVEHLTESANKELADLIVLALFASFERQLRTEILNKSSKLQEVVPTALGERLEILAKREIERWRISEIIDLFDFAVNGDVRGRMKQIVEYRNWVAHGKNPDNPPSSRTTEPKTTYDTIVDFINQIKDFYKNHTSAVASN
jgi:hypothetical protein